MCKTGAANRQYATPRARTAGVRQVLGIIAVVGAALTFTVIDACRATAWEGNHEQGKDDNAVRSTSAAASPGSITGGEQKRRPGVGLPVCRLPDAWSEDVTVTVNSEAVGAPGVEFVSRKMPPANQTPSWEICVRRSAPNRGSTPSILPVSNRSAVPVATLTLNAGVMSLVPVAGTEVATTRHLANCLFVFGVGQESITAQTRKPQTAAPLANVLAQPSRSVDFHLHPMPRAECCVAELFLGPPATDAELAKAIEIPDRPCVTIKSPLIMPLRQWPHALIEVRLIPQRDALRIVVVPRYLLGTQRHALTIEQIAKHAALQDKLYQRGRREVASARARLAKIPKEMREISRIKVRTPAQRGLRSLHLAVRDREAAKLQASLHRLDETLPQLKHNIKLLQDLYPIVQRLDQQLQISIRLIARTTAGDIVLGTTAER